MKKLIVISVLALAACTPKIIPTVTSSDPEKQMALNTGKQLYEDNCGKCHKLHAPAEFSAEEWNHNLDNMQPKAKITDEQRALIFEYLTYKAG